MIAPVGAVVRLSPYDWDGKGSAPTPGDFILSSGGTAYEILSARKTSRPHRYALVCLKAGGNEAIPEDASVHSLFWYSRDRRR